MENFTSNSQPPSAPKNSFQTEYLERSAKNRRVNLFVGLGALLFVILCLSALPAVIYYISAYSYHSTSLAEDPSKYSPVTYFAEAQNKAGTNAKLYELEARFVKSDGTQDLTATYEPGPTSEFTFYAPAEKPADAPPPGVGGSNWTQKITVNAEKPWTSHGVYRMGKSSNTRYTYINFGIDAEFEDPDSYGPPAEEAVDPPKCSLADLWQSAIKAGANPDAVSTITYDKNGYDFRISGDQTFNMNFGFDCQAGGGGPLEPSRIGAKN